VRRVSPHVSDNLHLEDVMAAQQVRFEYLEVGNVDGHIIMDRDMGTIDGLLGRDSHVQGVTARLLTPAHDDRQDGPSPFLVNMAKALDGAFHTLFSPACFATATASKKRLKAAPFYVKNVAKRRLYLWSPNGQTSSINEVSRADSLRAWTRDALHGNVMIDFLSTDLDNLRSTQRAWSQLYGDIIDPPLSRRASRPSSAVELAGPQDGQTSKLSLAAASAAKRIALAQHWPTAIEVSRALGTTAENESQLATRYRREGKLLAVYLPTPTASWRFPTWQFDKDGQPHAKFAEILRVVREHGNFFDNQRRTTGWGEVAWFNARRHSLDGASAAELLERAPDRVLAVARAGVEEA